MSIDQHTEINESKLMDFVFRAVGEVGATLNAALVVMGDKLGLYQALAQAGPLTPAELARRSGTAERYVQEWLNAQAAGGFVTYDPETGRTSASRTGDGPHRSGQPAYLPGFFQLALGSVLDSPRIMEAARTGAGFGWHEHGTDVLDGCERFFRPGYNANLISGWLPALDGVVGKLQRGALVADVGCGHGSSTILMAQAFPTRPCRHRLPRRLDPDRTAAGQGRRGRRPGPVRDRRGVGLRRRRVRPGDDVRLPARHGRPAGSGPPCPRFAEARRHLDDRRALCRGPGRG